MASVEHCLYCFEVLAAKLETRQPMALHQVESAWADYPKGGEDDEEPEKAEGEAITATNPSKPNGTISTSSPTPRPSVPLTNTPIPVSTSPSTNPTPVAAPTASTQSYTPIGVSSQRTSQRGPVTSTPLFVTWNVIIPTTHHRALRGCIGTFESQPLATGLASYALTSALYDTRFSPVGKHELSLLECAVTLLTDFEPCADVDDWDLGVHGIKISFYAAHKRYSATYLPDVAVEQGWDKEETMLSLMRKAGWSGKKEKWREVADLRVTRYQGKKESVEYEEYKKFKAWFASNQK
jgi:uncharacterized protein (TIGR00296 family)